MENAAIHVSGEHKRSALLTVLCVMTFLFSGLATVLSFAGLLSAEWLMNMLKPYLPDLANVSSSLLIVSFLLCVVIFGLSLWGAILMFLRRRAGFVLYIIPNGILLVGQAVLTFSAFNVMFLLFLLISILFILLYAMQVKFMKE